MQPSKMHWNTKQKRAYSFNQCLSFSFALLLSLHVRAIKAKRYKSVLEELIDDSEGNRICPEGKFSCGNTSTQCIPLSWRCDNDFDCEYGTDELDCVHTVKGKTKCKEFQFSCGGLCIALGWTCDGEIDCPDKSDESVELCHGVTTTHPATSCHYRGANCFDEVDSCVAYSKLCDGVADCADGSDEGLQCAELLDNKVENPQCPSLHCSYKCAILPNSSALCYCPEGQKPDPLNPSECLEVNGCLELSPCEQTCNHISGWNYTCSCSDGFQLQKNGRCVVKAEKMIVASRTALHVLSMEGKILKNVTIDSDQTTAMAVDINRNKVCWTVVKTRLRSSILICSKLNDFSKREEIHLPYSLDSIKMMNFDWLTGNLYFLDDMDERIFVCNISKQICITLMKHKLKRPVDFALDANEGKLFFISQGLNPKLERSDLQGRNHTVIVAQKIVYPRVIALDVHGKNIYFIDGFIDYIDSVDYNGCKRRTIFAAHSSIADQLHGLVYFNGSLFVANWQNSTISSISAWNRWHIPSKSISKIAFNIKHGSSLNIISNTQQPAGTNTCAGMACEHLCVASSPPYKGGCMCINGYTSTPDGRCQAPPVQDKFLMFGKAFAGEISAIDLLEPLSDKVPFVPIENLQVPKALDYYRDGDDIWVVFSDATRLEIAKRKIGTSENIVIFKDHVHMCEGLAYDWTSGNLYWTDEGYKIINVANITRPGGSSTGNFSIVRKIINNISSSHIRAIILYPMKGLMFWSTWENKPKNGSIFSSWMDGRNTTILASDHLIQWPNGLTIDYETDTLYWIDAFHDRIERMNIDGSNRHCLYSGKSPQLFHPYGAAFFRIGAQKYLFWTELKSGKIFRILLDSNSPKNITLMATLKPSLYSAVVYDSSARTDTGPCSTKQCSDFCFPVPTSSNAVGFVCDCPEGRTLKPDNITCEDIAGYKPESLCNDKEFTCNNGICINEKWTCDGEPDCFDGSDETLDICKNDTCGEGRFKCSMDDIPVCISKLWLCDEDQDCQSGEDEDPAFCKTCPNEKFLCNNGGCIPKAWKCDLDDDCGDNSDEPSDCVYNTCSPESEFTCQSGQCIPLTFKCDEENDCGDNSDEGEIANCKYACHTQDGFQCNSTRCIPAKWKCDGARDCEFGEDEEGCSPTVVTACSVDQFQCHSGTTAGYMFSCIAKAWRCDGTNDCKDGEDELGCEPIKNCSDQFACKNTTQCVSNMWVCDGDFDCSDHSDEANCACDPEGKQIRCLTWSQVNKCVTRCDGVVDCIDETDEDGCAYNGTCENAGCSHICTDYNNTFKCACPKGMKLAKDERKCKKIDYCSIRGMCSQQCVYTARGFTCECATDWILQRDGRTCAYRDPTPVPILLFTTRRSIRSIPLNMAELLEDTEYNLLSTNILSSFETIISIDYHYKYGKLFYSDVQQDVIGVGEISLWTNEDKAGSVRITSTKPILDKGLATVECVAVDWVADHIYFVESTLNQIEVMDLDGKTRSVVVAADMQNPRSLGLDPRDGLMFWTDWEADNGRIEKSSMAGEDRVVIWPKNNKRKPEDGWTNGLTVDYLERRIFWVDAKSDVIRSIKYDGTDEFTVLKNHLWLAHAYAITMFGHHLFWTDWSTTMLVATNKWNVTNVPVVELVISQPYDIKVYHKSRQPEVPSNPCENHPCDGLCLLSNSSSTGYRCKCPYGSKLAEDGLSCKNLTKILFFSGNSELRGMDPMNLNHSTTVRLTTPDVEYATALSVHAGSKSIYWIEENVRHNAKGFRTNIKRANFDASGPETVIYTDSGHASGLLIDESSGTIYWSTYIVHKETNKTINAQISVATLEGQFKHQLLSTGLTRPCCLTADFYQKFLFFGDVDGIWMTDLGGEELINIFNGTGVSALKYDGRDSSRSLWKDVLYFVKNGELWKTQNQNGTDWAWRSGKINLDFNLNNISSIEVYNDTIYLSQNGSIYTTSAKDPGHVKLSGIVSTFITDLLMLDTKAQVTHSPCSISNGDCDHLCLSSIKGKRCVCSSGFYTPIGHPTKCIGKDEFLIYGTSSALYIKYLTENTAANMLIGDLTSVPAVDYFAANDTILWIDKPKGKIFAAKRDLSWTRVVYSQDTDNRNCLIDLAMDWMSQNVYWTNCLGYIKVVKLTGEYSYTIHSAAAQIDKIELDPQNRILFGLEKKANEIIAMNLDGSNSSTLYKPQEELETFTYDASTKKLYCAMNKGVIMEVNLRGHHVPIRQPRRTSQQTLGSVAVHGDTLYWTNRDAHEIEQEINSCLISEDCQTETLVEGGILTRQYLTVKVYSKDYQVGSNNCSTNNGECDHLCFATPDNDKICTCKHKRVSKEDPTKCIDYDKFIMFSQGHGIRSVNVENDEKFTDLNDPVEPYKPPTLSSPVALTHDFANQRVFYSDIFHKQIRSYNPFTQGDETLVAEDVGIVEGIVYYRAENSLYWTMFRFPVITKINLNVGSRKNKKEVVFKVPRQQSLRAITIYECAEPHYLFWTNWGTHPGIYRSEIARQAPKQIISSDIKTPNGLTVDNIGKSLYWADASLGLEFDKIERCDLNGTNRKVILQGKVGHAFSLAVLGDFLYWSEWSHFEVRRVNKLTGHDMQRLPSHTIKNPFGVLAYYNDTCIATACDVKNACKPPLVCVAKLNGKKTCLCPNGYPPDAATNNCLDVLPPNSTCLKATEFDCGKDGLSVSRHKLPRTCIPYNITCDGTAHCADKSDELKSYCDMRLCRENYFRCANNKCIMSEFTCNGVSECGDGSDEAACSCSDEEAEFRCNISKRCIDRKGMCDGILNCFDPTKDEVMDASDENMNTTCKLNITTHECRKGFFKCNTTTLCVPDAFVCDAENDCGDNSDEAQCTTPRDDCPNTMFSCKTGSGCFPMTWHCDKVIDCDDGSDEADCLKTCSASDFTCKDTGRCISEAWRCDGEYDCSDKSDEADCSNTICAMGSVPCRDDPGMCILIKWLCDDDEDCSDGSDEIGCDHNCTDTDHRCDNTGVCVHSGFVCDGDRDCKDGSDERNCGHAHTPCASNQFQCGNGACIPQSGRCDGFAVCADLSDEENCTVYVPPTTAPPDVPRCDPETSIMCDSGTCINKKLACDGSPDCEDFSDEISCNINECSDKMLNNCQHKCIEKKYKYECRCFTGYRLDKDGHTCVDINECEEFDDYPPCSQKCTNKRGTYVCSCAKGYHQDRKYSSKCIADANEQAPFMIFANKFYLREMKLNGNKYKTRSNDLRNAVALDFDWKEKTLFLSDVTTDHSAIQKSQLFGNNTTSKRETIHKLALSSIHGIAVDWVVGNLYWTDEGFDTIEVSKISGRYRKTLIKSGLEQPRAIVLHPLQGYLYWSDWGKEPHIGRIGMDGSGRMLVVHNEILATNARNWPGRVLGWPNALTIDYTTDKLYWGDATDDYIAYSDLDGSNINMLLHRTQKNVMAAHVFALTIFEDTIYWSDWHKKSIMAAHKFRGNVSVERIKTDLIHRPMDLKVVHPVRQPMPDSPHPCTINNGGCRDLCLISPGGNHVCACPDNFYLAEDGVSCIANCTHSQFICKNHRCIPFWWKCDNEDDCGDNSDEADECPPFHCHAGSFQCHFSTADNSQCISPTALCDGVKDCNDGSDEINCEHHICLSTQFKCDRSNPPRCISSVFRCDGEVQCDNNEDEIGCPKLECQKDQIDCKDLAIMSNMKDYNVSECILRSWKCDGDPDCMGGVDELDCTDTECKSTEFRCHTGQCISQKWKCDAEPDCQDGSDEDDDLCEHKECEELEFLCSNRQCIPHRWRCDFDDDCGDNSDEEGCVPRECTSDEFTCLSNKHCIQASYMCDNEKDCEDGSDEKGCSTTSDACPVGYFRCQYKSVSKSCMPDSFKCDGDYDCVDGSDERNCLGKGPALCDSNSMTTCLDGSCILKQWKCDGDVDCLDSSDEGEAVCSECPPGRLYKCKLNPVCITSGQVCDGIVQCNGTGQDEKLCDRLKPSITRKAKIVNNTHCIMPQYGKYGRSDYGYSCFNGQCIPFEKLCDGVSECLDGTDEKFCLQSDCSDGAACSLVSASSPTVPFVDESLQCYKLHGVVSTGYYKSICSCRPGYRHTVYQQQYKCIDINECLLSNPCSQICINTKGSFHCLCDAGYIKSGQTGCRLNTTPGYPQPTVLIATGIPPVLHSFENIHTHLEQSTKQHHATAKSSRMMSMDVIGNTSNIIWADACKIYLWNITKNESVSKKIANLCPKSVISGLVVDIYSDNMFWLDQKTKRIYVSPIQNINKRKLLLSEKELNWPLDFTIDFMKGYLYVTEWSSSSSIRVYHFANLLTNRRKRGFSQPSTIFVEEDVHWPTSITVDPMTSLVYWVDAKKRTIEVIKPNKASRSVIHKFNDDVPYKISLHSDYIFVTMYRTSRVVKIRKVLGENTNEDFVYQTFISPPVVTITMPLSPEIYNERRLTVENICKHCAKHEICIPSDGQHICVKTCDCLENQVCGWNEESQTAKCYAEKFYTTPPNDTDNDYSILTRSSIILISCAVSIVVVLIAVGVILRKNIITYCSLWFGPRRNSAILNPMYVELQADAHPLTPDVAQDREMKHMGEGGESEVSSSDNEDTEETEYSDSKGNFHNPLYDRLFNPSNTERTQLLQDDGLEDGLSDANNDPAEPSIPS